MFVVPVLVIHEPANTAKLEADPKSTGAGDAAEAELAKA
jgi:hypothetical protein